MKKIILSLGLLLSIGLQTVSAQSYPSKPIRLVIPFPPGGGTDLISRELSVAMSKISGWNLIADNKPGAGGNLGIDAVAKATADGYTIGMGQTSNLAINPTLYSKLPYNPLKDLKPVLLVASSSVVLVVLASSKYTSLAELIADAKARPGAINSASPGNGTVAHLSSELMQQVGEFKLQHIPYKGANLALNDLMGGQVDMFMSSVPTVLGHIRSGKLRALAVTSLQRAAELPDVPTVAESGYPNFEAITWFGLVVPAGTPDEIVQLINKQANAAMSSPAFKAKLTSEGAVVLGGSSQAMDDFLKRDYDMWSKVVKQSGARVD
jgi:tripartite-type tricarboxylate transporter receptor subunit TctC